MTRIPHSNAQSAPAALDRDSDGIVSDRESALETAAPAGTPARCLLDGGGMRPARDQVAPVYELVGAPTGNCLRAAIALEAAGMRYTVRRLDLAAGQQRDVKHLALNPAGKVPVLTNGGAAPSFVLTQSNAIVLFAAEHAPQALLPGDAAARARAHERYFQVVTDIIGPSHAALRLASGAARAALEQLALDGAVQLEHALADHPYLAGPHFSIADIAGFTIVRSLAPRLDFGGLPRIAAWLARMGGMPAVRRGLAAFD